MIFVLNERQLYLYNHRTNDLWQKLEWKCDSGHNHPMPTSYPKLIVKLQILFTEALAQWLLQCHLKLARLYILTSEAWCEVENVERG